MRKWLLVLVVLAGCSSTLPVDPDAAEPPIREDPPPVETTTAPPPLHPDNVPVFTQDAALDAAYLACALERGFDPSGVQVLIDEQGKVWWVKTGLNVPAEVHGPCFEEIGGAPTNRSSYG